MMAGPQIEQSRQSDENAPSRAPNETQPKMCQAEGAEGVEARNGASVANVGGLGAEGRNQGKVKGNGEVGGWQVSSRARA